MIAFDLRAAMRCEYTATLEDGSAFLLHAGETHAIERLGNGGVYIGTPFGEAFVPWSAFSWHEEADVWCGLAEVAS